jgi:predicted FMN-binding regulatory protein PaiB
LEKFLENFKHIQGKTPTYSRKNSTLITSGKIQKNLKLFHGKNSYVHSALFPGKISIANITWNFSLGILVFTMNIPRNQLRKNS